MVRWNYFFLYIGRESPWLILLLFLSWVHSPMVKVAPAQFIWLVAPPTCTPRLTQVSSLIFCVEKSTFTLPCPTSGQSLFNLHSVQRQSVTIATSSIMLVRAIQNSWPQKNICNKQTNNPSMTSNNRWMLQKKMQPLNSIIFTCLTSFLFQRDSLGESIQGLFWFIAVVQHRLYIILIIRILIISSVWLSLCG